MQQSYIKEEMYNKAKMSLFSIWESSLSGLQTSHILQKKKSNNLKHQIRLQESLEVCYSSHLLKAESDTW